MTAITQDILATMSQRRAAGERVSELARELGIPWQKLEKITRRLSAHRLPDDPVRLRRELRWTRQMLEAVPNLGSDKAWALAWREGICRRLRSRIGQLRRRLARVMPLAQAPEKAAFWKPRASRPSDARIARQYDGRNTRQFWGE